MASEEEVRIVIDTIGNTAGAQNVAQSLQQIQQVAAQTQKSTEQLAASLQQSGRVSVQVDPTRLRQLQDALAGVRQAAQQISAIRIDPTANPQGVQQLLTLLNDLSEEAERVARIGIRTDGDPQGVRAVEDAIVELTRLAEQVRNIRITTTGDPAGAEQIEQTLKQVEQTAQQTKGSAETVANQMLRGLMAQAPQTLEAFQQNAQKVRDSLKNLKGDPRDLTLQPADFGIDSGAAAEQIAKTTTEATTKAKPLVSAAFAELMKVEQPTTLIQAGAGPLGQVQDFARSAAEEARNKSAATREALAHDKADQEDAVKEQARHYQTIGQQTRLFNQLTLQAQREQDRQLAAAKRQGVADQREADRQVAAQARDGGPGGPGGPPGGPPGGGGLNLPPTVEFARFGAALLGVGFGLSVFTAAGRLANAAMTQMVEGAIALDQSTRNLTAALGESATQYEKFAAQASRGTAFSQAQFQDAAGAVRPLAEQVGLTTNEVEGLVTAASKLATIHDIPLSSALEAMQQALHGSSQAVDQMGLSMSDQQVSLRAQEGAYRQTFSTLSDNEKVMLRYVELLNQIDTQQRNVAASSTPVAKRAQEVGQAMSALNTQIGGGPLAAIVEVLKGLSGAFNLSTEQQRTALNTSAQQVQNWSTYVDQVVKDTEAKIARPIPPPPIEGPRVLSAGEIFGPAGVAGAQQQLQQVQVAVGNAATATDQDLALLARRTAEVTVLTVDMARRAAEGAGAVTNAIQIALGRTSDPAEVARLQQVLQQVNRVAAANQALLQARRTQNELQYQGTQLTAQEAEIRLSMLPAQERMLELQNQANQAQIEATQRTLPATRALQDLQNRINLNRLIATSGARTPEERTAAAREGAAQVRQLPEAEIAATQAQMAALPTERMAQDIGLAAQLLNLQETHAVQGLEYSRQQLGFMQQIAEATTAREQRNVDVTVQGLSVTINQSGGFTDADEKAIVTEVNNQFAAALHTAVTSVNNQSSSQLIGQLTP